MTNKGQAYASGWTRMIAEATDHDTAMRFALAFGGKRVRFPKRLRDDSPLVVALGQEAAERLIAKFSDQVIEAGLEKRNLIVWLRNRGKSIEEISHTLRMSRRNVQYVLSDKMPRRRTWPLSMSDAAEQ